MLQPPSPAAFLPGYITESSMNIINVGYDSTNYYIIDSKGGKLLIDCGWPGTLPKFMAQLKRKGISIGEIKYLLVTHFHPDHAGLAQELKNLGIKLILLENQSEGISALTEFFKEKSYPYVEIKRNDNILLSFKDTRKFLSNLGIHGEILLTPGHSGDSITLVLDEGFAFTGDLHPSFIDSDDLKTRESWDKINQHNISRVFPGHGE